MPNVAALKALADKWAYAEASERANFALYLIDLCHALGVDGPGPAGSGCELELTIKVITKDGVEVANFIDCWRREFFAIEAKDQEPERSNILLRVSPCRAARRFSSRNTWSGIISVVFIWKNIRDVGEKASSAMVRDSGGRDQGAA